MEMNKYGSIVSAFDLRKWGQHYYTVSTPCRL